MSLLPAVSPSTTTVDSLTVTISDELYANFSQLECEQQEQARRLHANDSAGDNSSGTESSGCPVAWDGLSCWPAVPPSSLLQRSCRLLLLNIEEGASTVLRTTMHHLNDETFAYRLCDSEGHWVLNTTNYNACIALISQADSGLFSDACTHPTGICTWPAFIFTTIHRCACCSQIYLPIRTTRFYCNPVLPHPSICLSTAYVIGTTTGNTAIIFNGNRSSRPASNVPWACKVTLCAKLYSSNAAINWMFVEGHLLHSKVSTQVFKSSAPFRAYYTIGWGLPLASVVPWAVVTELSYPDRACWEGYARHSAVWFLIAPRLIAVLINSVFLVNIVRILISKAKADLTENSQFRAALKATLVLFPLLGLTHLLFAINPQNSIAIPRLKEAYLVLSAALQSSQGIFVSVIHCFMNGEVQDCLRTAYIRASLRRNPNRKSKSSCLRSAIVTSFQDSQPGIDPGRAQGHRVIKFEDAALHNQQDGKPIEMRVTGNRHELSITEVRLSKKTSLLQGDGTDLEFCDLSVHVAALSSAGDAEHDALKGARPKDLRSVGTDIAQV
ncbi:corticotropin-releasing factor receptor 1-like isoform X2 [Varroa jacobsoni]|uniref:corticotropin-releasing factor receptor 1-like isoform X2 n=1 Tax=Varroa jacobsoni TaxID=62625 RepID=UPI000BF519E9|nr:corticotropin-releasing factor receptor 1-like isoform X2 [Varroa jacobsoni]